jgi:hypothetical protein
MKIKNIKMRTLRFVSIFILLNLIGIQSVFGANFQDQMKDLASEDIYLPLIKNNARLQSIFGIEINNPDEDSLMEKAEESGAYWVRHLAFSWAEIEPTRTNPPTYNWSAVDETGLQNFKNKNLKTIGVVYHTPSWAQQISGEKCGPIASDDLGAFSQFVQALVARYGISSYNIKYWEFVNEPDAAWATVGLPDDSVYGCWGDNSDLVYYGGDYYAEMLKVAYPAVKAVDPNAQVLLGGLLLDCDPTNLPPGGSCPQGNFFRGVLSNGGGQYFDIVNYHAYPYEGWGKIYDEDHPGWINRGGIVLGKKDFLEDVMQDYGVDKPFLLSETALICPPWTDCGSDLNSFYDDQADYVMRLYANTLNAGLQGSIWYELEGPGFRESSLLYANENPKPAYNAYQFMTQEMDGAVATGELTIYSGVKTLDFNNSDIRIWVMWSTDQTDKSVNLPSNALRVLDRDGTVLYSAPVPYPITVNSPIYVELSK